MNVHVEKGYITEMECGSNFAYILSDNSSFLSTEYKVLQSQDEGCFVKCMKTTYNGKIQFYYLTSGLKSFSSLLSTLDMDNFITIITNIFSNILAVKNNGFLTIQNVDVDFEKIFVDPTTYKVALIYLPISKKLYSDESAVENELRTNIIKIISGLSTLSSPKTMKFLADLSNGMLSVKDLFDRLKGEKTAIITKNVKKSKLRIVTMNSPAQLEMEVNKKNFVIGKNKAAVDGVISFNNMISRVHCRVTEENGTYMVTDLQSTNGTYVNNVRLQPNQPCTIKHGDVIRLANSDFQVVIY
jgi:hypothetical protein